MNKSLITLGISLGLMGAATLRADVIVTEPIGGNDVSTDKAVNSTNGSGYVALGDIVLTEGATTDFAPGNGQTLILTAPGGWRLNPAAGAFEFDIASLSLPANTKLTATANYSQDPPGTHNGRVVTSLFSKPVAVQTAAQGLVIGSVALNASILTITWSGGNPPFQLQTNANLATGSWGNYGASLMGLTATIPVNTAVRQTFVRVVGQ